MVPVAELREENNKIQDCCDVLKELIGNITLRNNSIVCELIESFGDKVNRHLKHECRDVYSELLTHEDENLNEVAKRFINNTYVLNKLFNDYMKHWKRKHNHLEEYDNLIKETSEIFKLVEERIALENHELFPLLT